MYVSQIPVKSTANFMNGVEVIDRFGAIFLSDLNCVLTHIRSTGLIIHLFFLQS